MSAGDTTIVNRARTDIRLAQAVGFVWALSCMLLEQLCNEHGLDTEGKRA